MNSIVKVFLKIFLISFTICNIAADYESCGYRNTENEFYLRVTTNDNTKQYEFPWMTVVTLKYLDNDDKNDEIYHAGGSLIHPQVILTAAHRVYQKPVQILRVSAGRWDLLNSEEILPHQENNVSKIIVHEHFNPDTLINDIALLILEKPFVLNKHIRTICLPLPKYKYNTNEMLCTVAGWGKKFYEGYFQRILKKVKLPIVNNKNCEKILQTSPLLGNDYELDKSFLCAGGELGKDACTGDGGSPLFCPILTKNSKYFLQVGIVAWGIDCDGKFPGIYTNVSYLRSWIDRKMQAENFNSSFYNYST